MEGLSIIVGKRREGRTLVIHATCTCTMYVTNACTCMYAYSMHMYMYMYVHIQNVHVEAAFGFCKLSYNKYVRMRKHYKASYTL